MPQSSSSPSFLNPQDTFVRRHVSPNESEVAAMLARLELNSLEELIDETVPRGIRMKGALKLAGPRGENELIRELRGIAKRNELFKSYLGMGYSDCIVPPVIQRNILESPGWYTQYTPYQAEISQGRLEALLNFQTAIGDLTGLRLANASLLDEATAAAEAMHMTYSIGNGKRNTFFMSELCHPQTIAVVKTRAEAVGIDIVVGDHARFDFASGDVFGALVQYPATDGAVIDYAPFTEKAHANGALVVVACDLLALTLLRPPGEFGADIAIGSAQRFGVPLGYGGPHAAFLSTHDKFKRSIPGRIIGVSRDSDGKRALRMALQTREQHIRRDKATSNICTAQVLLAIMSSMYAVYHGPCGLRAIAERVHGLTLTLAGGLRELGHKVADTPVFDTLRVELGEKGLAQVLDAAKAKRVNLRAIDAKTVGIALDEATTPEDVAVLFEIFSPGHDGKELDVNALAAKVNLAYSSTHQRTSEYLTHPVFTSYHSEHALLRYIHRLQKRDLSLTTSMIALGSCTMKLNGTSEMVPVTWPEFGGLHPFVPRDQAQGYTELFQRLESALCEITGFAAVSLQPNAGSQGEYTGLLTIRAYHHANGNLERDVCLIPSSAHGTNPASAVMCGMKVVVVACDDAGNIDVADLKAKAEKHSAQLAALMVTYPSTHGVFEESIREICDVIHEHGGLVYMDGANMNAQVGLCRPGDFGADVCHLNLHKTFCIPHGGGGPGMGPIGCTKQLAPFLPGHPLVKVGGEQAVGAVSAAPWGSSSILPISYVYIALMGGTGLTHATKVAILNANYMAARLKDHYPLLYTGAKGRVAHEFILDLRPFEKSAHVTVEDVAKRLIDYGFHSPTMSFPVGGTLMIEPTESETKGELDRFCDALILIRQEIAELEAGRADQHDNALVNAPHTAEQIASDDWSHPYSRDHAAFPAPWVREGKFWPYVSRIDNGYGDKNLICSCPPIEAYEEVEVAENLGLPLEANARA